MSQSSWYALNQRLNSLASKVANIPVPPTPPDAYATLFGTQTFTGVNTFTQLPESVVVPTTDDQLVNKLYVDTAAGVIPTIDQVLGSGDTALAKTQIFASALNGIQNSLDNSQIILEDTIAIESNTLTRTGMAIITPLVNSSYTGSQISLSINDPLVGGGGLTEFVSATQSQISGGVAGLPNPPFPAPDGNFALFVDSATYNPTLLMGNSAPFTNSTSITLDLNNLTHAQGTGSPAPDNPFTISSNKDLDLLSSAGDINLDTPTGVVNINGLPFPSSLTIDAVLGNGDTATNKQQTFVSNVDSIFTSIDNSQIVLAETLGNDINTLTRTSIVLSNPTIPALYTGTSQGLQFQGSAGNFGGLSSSTVQGNYNDGAGISSGYSVFAQNTGSLDIQHTDTTIANEKGVIQLTTKGNGGKTNLDITWFSNLSLGTYERMVIEPSRIQQFGTGNPDLQVGSNGGALKLTAGTALLVNTGTFTQIQSTQISLESNGGNIQFKPFGSSPVLIASTLGGGVNPNFQITNSSAGAGNGVAMETYKNQSTAGTTGDEVFRLSMFGKNSGNTKEEYGRITCNIRDNSPSPAGADGQLLLAVPVGDTMTSFLDLNGNSNRVNCLRQLNIQNNDIISSAGDVHLNASASTGTGKVILQPKVGSYLIMNNLPTSVVGLPTGAVWNNLGVLNIAP